MRRKKLYIGSIIALVFNIITIFVGITVIAAFGQESQEIKTYIETLLNESGLSEFYTTEQLLKLVLYVYFVFIVLALIGLALSIALMILSKKTVIVFNKFRWVVILATVLEFIGVFFSLCMLSTFIGIIALACTLIPAIFYIIDLKNETALYNTYKNAQIYGSNQEHTNNTSRPENNLNDYQAQPALDDVEEKLRRLDDLKARGLVSDEDYARMKETIIKNHIQNN